MNTLIRSFVIVSILVTFAASPALAGEVTGLIEFQTGDPALAAEVNENFSAVKNAVNDNDARITSNTDEITVNTNDITYNATGLPCVDSAYLYSSATLTSSYTDVLNVAVYAPSNGFVYAVAKGIIQLSGKTNSSSSDYCSVYVGVSETSSTIASPSDEDITRFYISGTGPAGSFELPYHTHSVFPVSQGNHTFYLVATENGGSGSGRIWRNRLTAMFIKNSF